MEPRPWQAKEVAEHGNDPKRLIRADPRTGKTHAAIWTSQRWGVSRCLVCCPLVVAPDWAQALVDEGETVVNLFSGNKAERLARIAPPPSQPRVAMGRPGSGSGPAVPSVASNASGAHGRAEPGPDVLRVRAEAQPELDHVPAGVLDLLARARSAAAVEPDRRTVYYVVNYDFLDSLPPSGWDGLIGDESHYIKGVSSERGKTFRRLARRARFVRLLTGTPAPNHYGDLWGQLSALDKPYWGSYGAFAARYLITDPVFPSRVLGHTNVDELQRRMEPFVTSVRREDVFGPDTFQFIHRKVEMPPKARHAYETLAKEWIYEQGEETVTATHVLKRMVRLQQLASGFLPSESGDYALVHDAKVDAVDKDLASIVYSGEKAIVFHRFRWESDAYAARAKARAFTIVINGDTPIADRDTLRRAFQTHDGPAIAVVQIQAGGIGISFSEANHALFTTRSFSFTEDEQAMARVYKPGAVRVVTYYEVDRTIDHYIAKTLSGKRTIHHSIANMDKEAMAYGYIRAEGMGKARKVEAT